MSFAKASDGRMSTANSDFAGKRMSATCKLKIHAKCSGRLRAKYGLPGLACKCKCHVEAK